MTNPAGSFLFPINKAFSTADSSAGGPSKNRRKVNRKKGNREPIIAIANLKGGVGKSTLTGLLARHLGDYGKNVIVIDLDPGLGATFVFFSNPDTFEVSIRDVLHAAAGESQTGETAGELFFRAVQPANAMGAMGGTNKGDKTCYPEPRIFAIPGYKNIDKIDSELPVSMENDCLNQILDEVTNSSSIFKNTVVLIDCPANHKDPTTWGIRAADFVVVPVTFGDTVIKPTAQTFGILNSFAKRGIQIPFGIVPMQTNMQAKYEVAFIDLLINILDKSSVISPNRFPMPNIPATKNLRAGNFLSRDMATTLFRPLREILITVGSLPVDSMPPEEPAEGKR